MNDSDLLTVTMTAGEWNRALALMGKASFEVSADLILKIREQCMQQSAALSNGAAAHGSLGVNDPGRPPGNKFKLEPAAHAPD